MPGFRSLLLVVSLAISTPAMAWNEFGHMLIAELALQKLSPKLQRKIESEAFSLVRRQDSDKRLYLMRAYPGSSAFAQIAVFADHHRDKSLAELYGKFGQKLPAVFADLAGDDTTRWHYKNQPYAPGIVQRLGIEPSVGKGSAASCDLSEPVDVAWAIEQTRVALSQAETESDRVLSLALLIHFVGDAHQPLHAISRVDEDCESDRGGNRFCVAYGANSYSCVTSLHEYWDAGLGFFRSFDRVGDAAEFVARISLDEAQVKNLDADAWLAEGFRQARFVYSIQEGTGGDPHYVKEAQIIAYERIALAAARLAQILGQLY